MCLLEICVLYLVTLVCIEVVTVYFHFTSQDREKRFQNTVSTFMSVPRCILYLGKSNMI